MGDIGEPALRAGGNKKKLYTFDDVIRERAEDLDQEPLVAYPKTKDGVDDYEFFNGKELNRLVDGATKSLIGMGIEPVYKDTVAGIYGPSTFSYAITVFALGRLGYTTFILSPRLPVSACVSLLSNAKVSLLLHAPKYLSLATKTSQEYPLKLFPILERAQYDTPNSSLTPEFRRENIDGEQEKKKILIYMHSSGSTGTPKPIDYKHIRLFATFRTAQKFTAFASVPLFHAVGFISLIQAIFVRKCVFMFNGLVPQTNETVTKAIKGAVINGEAADVVNTVPYVLKLLCEGGPDGEGVQVLKGCKLVSCSGSKTPDELGDLLVDAGVNFGTVFGATEVALILHSLNRPPGDNAWNYLRPPPHIAPFILMRPLPSQSPTLSPHEVIHECIVLDGHIGKMSTNSNDPPNSFHTSDLFIPHPTIPNAWKSIGRLDDRITLLNGEKVLPLAIEGRITQHPFVREAVVFGVDRSVPGLLLFRSENAKGLSDGHFLDEIWSVIEEANEKAEGFSQVGREMVVVLGEEVECPVTDKSSIKRAAVYRNFKEVIDGVYSRLESEQEGTLVLDEEELENWIVEKFAEVGIELENTKMDFFSMGVDSLKAIQMRAVIIKSLNLGGNAAKVSSMVVYDSRNVAGLAKALVQLRTGASDSEEKNEICEMEELIKKYSIFEKKTIVEEKKPDGHGHVVLLTGATGSLGSHILNQLISISTVSSIICPIRTTGTQTPLSRLSSSLQSRGFPTLSTSSKLHPIILDEISTLPHTISSTITHIIHTAWPVNFALPLSTFIPHLSYLQDLINLSISHSAKLLFCSSIGVATSSPSSLPVKEEPIPSLSHASPTGYARSKLVAEKILEIASTKYGADVHILRVGQIIPSLRIGEGSTLWNPNEMIPLMVRSALVIGCLPGADGEGFCAWIDLGTLSRCVVSIAGLDEDKVGEEEEERLVYNLVGKRWFIWGQFLGRLKESGLKFEIVGREEWIERLRDSEGDVEKNPSRKLLGFWEAQGGKGAKEVLFETEATERKCMALKVMGTVIGGDYVERLLIAWEKVW